MALNVPVFKLCPKREEIKGELKLHNIYILKF